MEIKVEGREIHLVSECEEDDNLLDSFADISRKQGLDTRSDKIGNYGSGQKRWIALIETI